MNPTRTIRLSKSVAFQRPKYTVQDKLTEEEIDEKLQDYKEVDDIREVPVGTHVRYFVTTVDKKTGQSVRKFRLGGMLKDKEHADKYVVLTNGTLSWSVQVKDATFYKKMTLEEIKDEYEMIIQEKADEIKLLKKQVKVLKNELSKYM